MRRTFSRPLATAAAALLALLAALPTPARAEIAIGESLEWLTASATRVLTGRIVAQRDVDPRATGKNADLQLLTVQVTGTLRGPASGPKVCVAVRQGGLKDAATLRQQGVELILFLGETVQATSFEGRVCNLWPLRGGDALPAIVRLDQPGKRLLAAGGFKVLGQRAAIVAAVQTAARGLPAPKAGQAAPPQRFLEVPPGTEVYRVLYGGSTCYLIVPAALFPQARPKLGR